MKFKVFVAEAAAPNMTEDLFVRLLNRFNSTSGSLEMGDHDDWFQKHAPGVEPWKWARATTAVAKLKGRKK